MDKKLFFYELEGRGYTFQNKNWDAAKHGFEDDMLNMAWEMWSSGQVAKAQTPESNALLSAAMDAVQKLGSGNFVLVPKEPTMQMMIKGIAAMAMGVGKADIYEEVRVVWVEMITDSEQTND